MNAPCDFDNRSRQAVPKCSGSRTDSGRAAVLDDTSLPLLGPDALARIGNSSAVNSILLPALPDVTIVVEEPLPHLRRHFEARNVLLEPLATSPFRLVAP